MITVLLIDHDEEVLTPGQLSHSIVDYEGVETVMNITTLIKHQFQETPMSYTELRERWFGSTGADEVRIAELAVELSQRGFLDDTPEVIEQLEERKREWEARR